MGFKLKFWDRGPKRSINILFIFPNKDINIFQVDATKKTWSSKEEGDNTSYFIDEKATYFWKGKPILFYRHGVASPLIFGEEGEVDYSLKAEEVKAVLESKAVKDLLTAGDDGTNWTLILAAAAAGLSLVSVLVQFHVIKVPGGG